ncbi:unnamed protein product, partial [Ectocarpus fasciculatus]
AGLDVGFVRGLAVRGGGCCRGRCIQQVGFLLEFACLGGASPPVSLVRPQVGLATKNGWHGAAPSENVASVHDSHVVFGGVFLESRFPAPKPSRLWHVVAFDAFVSLRRFSKERARYQKTHLRGTLHLYRRPRGAHSDVT